MFKRIDAFLNNITMYRLVLYGLILGAMYSLVLSIFQQLPFTPIQLLLTHALIMAGGHATHYVLYRLTKAVTNQESYLISLLILYFVIAPINNTQDALITLLATVLAMASKYVLAIRKKHIFNPVAISVFVLGILGFGNAIWWAGSLVLLPYFALFGMLIVRKVRRFDMFVAFVIAASIMLSISNLRHGIVPTESLLQLISSWPLIFFGTIMLTEPLTTPPHTSSRVGYGVLVGILFGSQFAIPPIFSSPELALIIGNLFSYLASPKLKLFLAYKSKREIAKNIYEIVFEKNKKFNFLPGQYMEWTLPHDTIDSRGNRRYFTIASSPTEGGVLLGIKQADTYPSSYKRALMNLAKGNIVVADQLSGDFTLPQDTRKKLVFIAGGIGVTPFRSMVKYMIDTGEERDIVFYYFAHSESEFAYKDIFSQGVKLGLKMIYVISSQSIPKNWSGEIGKLNPAMIAKHLPDYDQRTFYISGPNVMVDSYTTLLKRMGISPTSIVVDYFPGY